jgi:adenosylhomocysteine nucleosidase
MPEIAMVAALEREVGPLVKDWPSADREYAGRKFRFFENENCVVVCGGIGAEAARRAAEAVIALYEPRKVWSVGFAGALEKQLRVGELVHARQVVDAQDGSRVDTGSGGGVLVSFSSVAGEEQKAKLAKAYGAQAVDIEATSVAKSAQAHGLTFAVVKVISDELGFPMPPMEKFTAADGSFRTGHFVLYAAKRPWVWGAVIRLARNSEKAARALCADLQERVLITRGEGLSVQGDGTQGPSTPRSEALRSPEFSGRDDRV